MSASQLPPAASHSSGFVLETNQHAYLTAHRILLLVQGTTPSKLEPLGDQSQSLAAQSFHVSSVEAQCLLSDTETFVDLYGYCDFEAMLQYRLDKDSALVTVSAVDIQAATQQKIFTVEHITKVQDWRALKVSLDHEWQTALRPPANDAPVEFASPEKKEYWVRDVKRLKRMRSEPWVPEES